MNDNVKLFVKKPVQIEAIQWTGYNMPEIRDFVTDTSLVWCNDNIYITTLEGVMTASIGDWIIKGIMGEFYPCKPEIFEATYDEVVDESRALNHK